MRGPHPFPAADCLVTLTHPTSHSPQKTVGSSWLIQVALAAEIKGVLGQQCPLQVQGLTMEPCTRGGLEECVLDRQ